MTKLNQIEQKFCEELTKSYGKTFDEVLKVCDLNTLSNDEKEHLRIFFVFRTKYNSKKRESIFKDIKIWNMPEMDIQTWVMDMWKKTYNTIKTGNIVRYINK